MSGTGWGRWAVIVADGDGVAEALPVALAEAAAAGVGPPLVIAADGGAARALAESVTPDLVVGDGDSLTPDTRRHLAALGVHVDLAPVDKDESDTELCVRAALDRDVAGVLIVGALGGARLEHAVANLLLLAHPLLDATPAAIVAPPSRVSRVGRVDGPGTCHIRGAPGDAVSLLAVDTQVDGVRTDGLHYPLHGEPLRPGPARGLSNRLLTDRAHVRVERGRLLVIHTALPPSPTEEDS